MGDAPDGLSVVGYTTEPAEAWDSNGPASQTEDLPTIELRFPDWTGFWTHSRQAALLDATPWTSRMTEFACPS